MVGLTTDLLERLKRSLTTRERLIKSTAQKAHDAGIMKTVNYLRQQAKERNISSMLDDERIMLSHSLEFDANSQEEKNSLKTAIGWMKAAAVLHP
jgi:hypothetical protein